VAAQERSEAAEREGSLAREHRERAREIDPDTDEPGEDAGAGEPRDDARDDAEWDGSRDDARLAGSHDDAGLTGSRDDADRDGTRDDGGLAEDGRADRGSADVRGSRGRR